MTLSFNVSKPQHGVIKFALEVKVHGVYCVILYPGLFGRAPHTSSELGYSATCNLTIVLRYGATCNPTIVVELGYSESTI